MLRTKSSLTLSVVVMLLAVTGCTNDNLDDGGSADVVLEIETLENPPVTATLDSWNRPDRGPHPPDPADAVDDADTIGRTIRTIEEGVP